MTALSRSATPRVALAGLLGLVGIEVLTVWCLTPLPYSQQMRSLPLAYALFHWRWWLRALCVLAAARGIVPLWQAGGWRRWSVPVGALLAGAVVWTTTMTMAADRIFRAPERLTMATISDNTVAMNRLVLGVALNGEARAYPVQFIGYHHQVRDTVGGTPVLITFCTVCRTGRVYSPMVDGRVERFRLVGMDHFNAMLEDAGTGSWWRQATGEAVAGPRTGTVLQEIPSQQMTLATWVDLHPTTRVMQADAALRDRYDTGFDYETGTSRSALTGTDTASWQDKSWVVGITVGGTSKAYDWNRLRRERAINDVVGGTPLVIVLARDGASFFAFERPNAPLMITMRGDSLVAGTQAWSLGGRGASGALTPIRVVQEFWHSWRTFQPGTLRDR